MLKISPPITQTGPADAEELEAFLDALFDERMQKLHISGVFFVLMKDREIFFAKGYGYSDLEKKELDIPGETVEDK